MKVEIDDEEKLESECVIHVESCYVDSNSNYKIARCGVNNRYERMKEMVVDVIDLIQI